jgi:hypothetical protein
VAQIAFFARYQSFPVSTNRLEPMQTPLSQSTPIKNRQFRFFSALCLTTVITNGGHRHFNLSHDRIKIKQWGVIAPLLPPTRKLKRTCTVKSLHYMRRGVPVEPAQGIKLLKWAGVHARRSDSCGKAVRTRRSAGD